MIFTFMVAPEKQEFHLFALGKIAGQPLDAVSYFCLCVSFHIGLLFRHAVDGCVCRESRIQWDERGRGVPPSPAR
jgi:hypothetical protein